MAASRSSSSSTASSESDDPPVDFESWLRSEVQTAQGADIYPEVFEKCVQAAVKWRARYQGHPALWRRIFKRDRFIKELVETAPVIDAVMAVIGASDPTEEGRFTIVDLCCGKGFLSMFLSEILDPNRVEKLVLVDKAWPRCGAPLQALPHQISWEHIYGHDPPPTTAGAEAVGGHGNGAISDESNLPTGTPPQPAAKGTDASGDPLALGGGGESHASGSYFGTWPIPLHTSKQDLKSACTRRAMGSVVFDRAEGPVLVLAVHLCGTLSLKACDLWLQNNPRKAQLLVLKPCCLPPMMHAKRDEVFEVGPAYRFASADVCASGKFKNKAWAGPPRWHLESRFEKWANHLASGLASAPDPSAAQAGATAQGGMTAAAAGAAGGGGGEGPPSPPKPPLPQTALLGSGGVRVSNEKVTVQVKGGFQNRFVFAERGLRPHASAALWDRLAAKRQLHLKEEAVTAAAASAAAASLAALTLVEAAREAEGEKGGREEGEGGGRKGAPMEGKKLQPRTMPTATEGRVM